MGDTSTVIDLDDEATPAPAEQPAEPGVVDLPDDEGAVRLPPNATLLEGGMVRLVLGHPVTLGFRKGGEVREETFDVFLLRRLNGQMMNAVMAAKDGSQAKVMAQHSTGISPLKFNAVWDRMDGSDISALADVMGFFLQPGRPTGR